jgi:hypothetical protein
VNNFETAQFAIKTENMEWALKAVQKLQPADLRRIIKFALGFDTDVARAVIALAEAMLLAADLEQQLEEVKKELADLRRAREASPPSNDDSSPSPF